MRTLVELWQQGWSGDTLQHNNSRKYSFDSEQILTSSDASQSGLCYVNPSFQSDFTHLKSSKWSNDLEGCRTWENDLESHRPHDLNKSVDTESLLPFDRYYSELLENCTKRGSSFWGRRKRNESLDNSQKCDVTYSDRSHKNINLTGQFDFLEFGQRENGNLGLRNKGIKSGYSKIRKSRNRYLPNTQLNNIYATDESAEPIPYNDNPAFNNNTSHTEIQDIFSKKTQIWLTQQSRLIPSFSNNNSLPNTCMQNISWNPIFDPGPEIIPNVDEHSTHVDLSPVSHSVEHLNEDLCCHRNHIRYCTKL